jgi:apolipoprotein D and lipocalin family protein
MKKLLLLIMLTVSFLLTGCKTYEKPQNVKPVENFKLNEYLGTWYEIVRLEHRFEKGMEAITATYSMRDDNGVKILNKGYKTAQKEWSDAEGKAYFVGASDEGFLKVSFFGPFYGSYVVMDTDYKTYTMISGPDLSYFWILSRTPKLDQETLNKLLAKAKDAGFDTSVLIYPNQSMNENKY